MPLKATCTVPQKSKEWWKICQIPTKFYNNKNLIIKENTNSLLESNTQKSITTTHDIGKLFPRNMPSIRRSRRRTTLQKSIGIGTNNVVAPHAQNNNYNNNTKKKLTAKNNLKVNCSQREKISKVSCKIPTDTAAYVSKLQIQAKKAEQSLQVQSLVNSETKETPHMSLNSQQSSLISYDLSSNASHLSSSTECGQKAATIKRLLADETFHSSGVSCNDETHSESSCNSLRLLKMQTSNLSLTTEEEALIEAEVAQLTNSLTSGTNKQYPKAKVKANKNGGKCTTFLPVSELQNLYTSRNRNALWLHSWSTEPTASHAHNAQSHCRHDDDIQLSDLEEQLALVHGQSKTNLSRSATHKK